MINLYPVIMDITHCNGIFLGVPTLIKFWPEKEVHRFVTYRKEIDNITVRGDPCKPQLRRNLKQFVQQQEEKAQQYFSHLSLLTATKVGTRDQPKDWTPIPADARRLWDKHVFSLYQLTRYMYDLYLLKTDDALGRRQEIGVELLLMEEQQAAIIKRVGLSNLIMKENFCIWYEESLAKAGQLPPSQEDLDNAWSDFETNGYEKLSSTDVDR